MHRIIAIIVGLVTGGLGVTALTTGTQAANAALASTTLLLFFSLN